MKYHTEEERRAYEEGFDEGWAGGAVVAGCIVLILWALANIAYMRGTW